MSMSILTSRFLLSLRKLRGEGRAHHAVELHTDAREMPECLTAQGALAGRDGVHGLVYAPEAVGVAAHCRKKENDHHRV